MAPLAGRIPPPAGPDRGTLRGRHRERVRFHQWAQWLLDAQLARVAAVLPVMHDLPIGVDPNGADAWVWQDLLATDVTVGAPPDEFNTLGQNWGLPAFVPHKLRAAAYQPLRHTLQAAFRHAAGLRIDHVMGLFRLFWIPPQAEPSLGAYVRSPADELLAILALESHRAHAFVVGEDLGTVEAAARDQLDAHGLLSYRLLWFETAPPSRYPARALAAVTTHDLPTITGLWSGADLQAQHELGLQPNTTGLQAIRQRLQAITGLPEEAAVDEVVLCTHQRLAEAPSAVIVATLEDVLAVAERPNMPNTTTEWPNWSRALPCPLEALEHHPLVQAVATALQRDDKPHEVSVPTGGLIRGPERRARCEACRCLGCGGPATSALYLIASVTDQPNLLKSEQAIHAYAGRPSLECTRHVCSDQAHGLPHAPSACHVCV